MKTELTPCPLISSRVGVRRPRCRRRPQVRILKQFANIATAFVPASELAFHKPRELDDFVCHGSFVLPGGHELFVTLDPLDELFTRSLNLREESCQLWVLAHSLRRLLLSRDCPRTTRA